MIVLLIIYLVIVVFLVASMWIVYEKAGQPGWAAIVPIYNVIIFCRMAGYSGWWCLTWLFGVTPAIVTYKVANSFGKGLGFTHGMALLPFVFWPMLAFGDAAYSGTPFGGSPKRSRRSISRFDDEDDEDEDDRRQSRSRMRDEDDDDRPRKRRDEDDDDDRPRRR